MRPILVLALCVSFPAFAEEGKEKSVCESVKIPGKEVCEEARDNMPNRLNLSDNKSGAESVYEITGQQKVIKNKATRVVKSCVPFEQKMIEKLQEKEDEKMKKCLREIQEDIDSAEKARAVAEEQIARGEKFKEQTNGGGRDDRGSGGGGGGGGGNQAGGGQQGDQQQGGGGGGGGMPSLPGMGGGGSGSQASNPFQFQYQPPHQACGSGSTDPVCESMKPKYGEPFSMSPVSGGGDTSGPSGSSASSPGAAGDPTSSSGFTQDQPAQASSSPYNPMGMGYGSGAGDRGTPSVRGGTDQRGEGDAKVPKLAAKPVDPISGTLGGGSAGSSSSIKSLSRPNRSRSSSWERTRAAMLKRQANVRGPAAQVGPDGVTGPHSDMFRKIRIRYADMAKTLLQ